MDLKNALVQAIQAERNGHGFYMMAANSTEDGKGKDIFHSLAAEELNHMNFLRGQYDSIVKTGLPDMTLRLGNRIELEGGFPIFSESLISRISSAHYEMSALAIGIQLELDAMNFYKTQADAATDSYIKKFFLELAEWESGHYNALLRQHDSLKEDYWSDSGFAPF
jgi:rubrerythrin